MSIKLCFISDTHSLQDKIDTTQFHSDIDILIHSGDMSSRGDPEDINRFSKWFSTIPAKHRVCIAGNHDFCFEIRHGKKDPSLDMANSMKNYIVSCLETNGKCHYLEDSSVTLENINIYGSPWQPEFHSWAFNLPRNGPELKEKWRKIPKDTDVLITHGPPKGVLDFTSCNCYAGCERLGEHLKTSPVPIHAFGHIHEAYGVLECLSSETLYINASTCTIKYNPINPPIYVLYEPKSRTKTIL